MGEQYKRFGDVALAFKFVTAEQLAEALTLQAQRKAKGNNVLLGQILLELGYLNESQIRKVLDVLYPVEEFDCQDG